MDMTLVWILLGEAVLVASFGGGWLLGKKGVSGIKSEVENVKAEIAKVKSDFAPKV